jgi:myo-inositol 2-dehydrogenase/D-chiro-inositol 1-dehydrogenase
MRVALVGNHPDGVDLAGALVDSGRHQLVAHTAPVESVRRRWGPDVKRVADLEEVLADPAVEAVLVAGPLALRPEQLRRALQSERHVLCVHPADLSPEAAYEASLIQQDTRCLLLPILPEGLHPAVRRLADFVDRQGERSPVGAFLLLEVERASTGELLEVGPGGHRAAFPGWDVLRVLGGEVAEVSAFAVREEVEPGAVVLLAGRFEGGGLFQTTLLPNQPEARWRLAVVGNAGRAELTFPLGWEGPAFLEWRQGGERREEHWERWDPWPAFEAFERAAQLPTWQDEVRALELDDAARRSVERRRANLMEYQEASEEVGFKGTMTLAGCALLWGALLLLIVSRWVPQLGWLILPLLVVFIVLQLLRYAIPRPPEEGGQRGHHESHESHE